MRILNVMQASTLDYQFIILPLLKSFMRELFEVLVDKDTKKADAAREALLSEIELEAKKKKNFESKKKNKNQRKNKDPKVTQGDDLYVPQEETEEPVHFPVSYNGDYPSSVIVVAARADELGLQEEELKHHILCPSHVVPSTYHQLLRFPTKQGIEQIHGSQKSAQTCYLLAAKTPRALEVNSIEVPDRESLDNVRRLLSEKAMETLDRVEIVGNPDRFFMIGASLNEVDR
ncbi:uncharacterized protein LOC114295193 [Camellia sinensis]|uniref:uncharacterized protein LOC114295193 n=1 Tax=Camellia sinensis TaxID=4442 RepID=UPI0010365A7C|nr:uncharacterized protein LOC114295193 [Camellia sinensis]